MTSEQPQMFHMCTCVHAALTTVQTLHDQQKSLISPLTSDGRHLGHGAHQLHPDYIHIVGWASQEI